jgi:RNA polymerase sigma factor (sigma-70 family)
MDKKDGNIERLLKQVQNNEGKAASSAALQSLIDRFNSEIQQTISNYWWWHHGTELQEDLEQEARIAFAEAVKSYDATRSEFAKYARTKMRFACSRYVERNQGAVGVPRDWRKVDEQISSARNEFSIRHGRMPTDTEVAEITRIPLKKIREHQRVEYRFTSMCSLDDPEQFPQDQDWDEEIAHSSVWSEPSMHAEFVEDAEEEMEDWDILYSVLDQLPPSYADLVRSRYGLNKQKSKLADLAEQEGVTPEAIRQRQLKAVHELTAWCQAEKQRRRVLRKQCAQEAVDHLHSIFDNVENRPESNC